MAGEAKQAAIIPLRRLAPARRGPEREFLPAAVEILETPASPAGRAIGRTIILFFALALAWATFGYVDIIATAQGKIVPTVRTKIVQPLESGIVTAIHVRDSDQVVAGQVLVELDSTINAAERKRIGHDLLRSRLDVARLSALRAGIEAGTGPVGFAPPADAPLEEIERSRATMLSQATEQAAKLSAIEQQIAQKIAEAQEIAGTIAKLEASLPLVQQLAELRRKAMELEYGNRVAYLESQARMVEQQHELIVQRHRASEVAAAREALEWQRAQTTAEYAHKLFGELTDAELKAAQLAQDTVKADEKLAEQKLRAPVDGTVQQIAVHTVGGVVTPAQQLMVIVPADSRLEVEAMISNRDIGFVREGQPAEIKIDTFNFTRYGLLHGQVRDVSQDAIVRDKPAAKQAPRPAGALAESSEPQGQELLYATHVSLDRTQMEVEGHLVNLGPGMAVTVEIKTGARRLIEYLLSPLLRYKQESLRER